MDKEWETTMNTQRRCGYMSKITENWQNTTVFGHMEHYNRSNVAPVESYKMSEHNIFLLQPFEHQHICKVYLKDRLSQVSVQEGYCLFWMHTTLSITQLYKSPIRANKTHHCQDTPQPIGVPSHTVMEIHVLIAMTHHFSNIFLVELW